MAVLSSIAYFILAGLLEIGGGYLVWLSLREGRSTWLAVIGAIALAGYGVVATLQPANFGRVYAAYGGVFIVLALSWGWAVDGHRPDRWDFLGGALCVFGMAVIMYGPRSGAG
ncbi:MAG: YnfA family protein [Gemmatimonadales bacterium]|jgi:small multidrug resistance family-3 protein